MCDRSPPGPCSCEQGTNLYGHVPLCLNHLSRGGMWTLLEPHTLSMAEPNGGVQRTKTLPRRFKFPDRGNVVGRGRVLLA